MRRTSGSSRSSRRAIERAEVVGHDLGDRRVRFELELAERLAEAQRVAGADLLELGDRAVELDCAAFAGAVASIERGELVPVHAVERDLEIGTRQPTVLHAPAEGVVRR